MHVESYNYCYMIENVNVFCRLINYTRVMYTIRYLAKTRYNVRGGEFRNSDSQTFSCKVQTRRKIFEVEKQSPTLLTNFITTI